MTIKERIINWLAIPAKKIIKAQENNEIFKAGTKDMKVIYNEVYLMKVLFTVNSFAWLVTTTILLFK